MERYKTQINKLQDKKVYYLPFRDKSEFPLYTFRELTLTVKIHNWFLNKLHL